MAILGFSFKKMFETPQNPQNHHMFIHGYEAEVAFHKNTTSFCSHPKERKDGPQNCEGLSIFNTFFMFL